MTLAATAAAKVLERNQDNISSHALISLLMAGGLERISQAKLSLKLGKDQEADVLIEKTIAIVNGLRDCLNFENGGEIAKNLNELYRYMATRMAKDADGDQLAMFDEMESLLSQVKAGWDNMDVDSADLALELNKTA